MKSRALFLDRDGVVIESRGYIRDAALVELVPGIASLMREARAAGQRVLLVTNQSGIGRGWVTHDEYLAVSERMIELLRAENAFFDHLFYAPFYSDSPKEKNLATLDYASLHVSSSGKLENQGHWHETWRKPDVGMVERARELYDLDIRNSFVIGDRLSDLEFAGRAEMKKAYLLKPQEVIEQMSADSAVVKELKSRWEKLRQSFPRTQFELVHGLDQVDRRDFK